MKSIALAALAALIVAPAPAFASHHDDRYDNHRHDRHHCGGGSGATGTIVGGVGGALVGNAVGGGTAGTVAGGVGGALLGRHIDKHDHRKHC